MKLIARVTLVLGLSLLLLVVYLRVPGFEFINTGMDRLFGAAPRWAQVRHLVKDPRFHETSGGDRPAESLRILNHFWSSGQPGRRIVFMGNSQMQHMSLAPGETATTGQAERTYFDLVSDHFQSQGVPALFYRLSNPGMNYQEALWYLDYLTLHPGMKPDTLVFQINYQAFWLSGIRAGMLDLLNDPAFRSRVEQRVAEKAPFSPVWSEALRTYETRRSSESPAVPKGFSSAQPLGTDLETSVRLVLSRWPAFHAKGEQKEEFLNFLYRIRLYVFRLKPSTGRSITGVRLERSQAAVEAILTSCKSQGIQVLLFSAPLNPEVVLYRTPEDKQAYIGFLNHLEDRFGARTVRLDDLVPAAEWGRWFNGPDPLHLGKAGHQRVAAQLEAALEQTVR